MTVSAELVENNPYYGYFKEVVGRGSGQYYPGIGQVYRARRGIQRGYGHFFAGTPYRTRRGLGIGSALMSLFRMASPILRVLGSKAVDVAANIAKDSIQGDNFKSSAIKHTSTGAKQLLGKVPEAFSGLMTKNIPPIRNELSTDSEPAETGANSRIATRKNPAIRRRKRPPTARNISFPTKIKRGRGSNNYPALQYM